MTRIVLLMLACLTLAGCGEEKEWVTGQREKCGAMKGRGAYQPAERLFECYRVPFALKIDVNADLAHQAGVIKLFDARYTPKGG